LLGKEARVDPHHRCLLLVQPKSATPREVRSCFCLDAAPGTRLLIEFARCDDSPKAVAPPRVGGHFGMSGKDRRVDRRAVKTLVNAYWSPAGWRDPPVRPPEDELAHAIDAGVMFDGSYDATHDEIVDAVIAAREALGEDEVTAAFLSSLSSRRLDLRSALGSFAVARHLKRHAHDPDSAGHCQTCRLRPDEHDIDRNVMSFERFKWGGVRRDDLVYIAFDLERFASADHPEATSEDRALLEALLDELEAAPPSTTAPKAATNLLRALKGNKAERAVFLDILGVCSVLETTAHRGYAERFVRHADRDMPGKRFVEHVYPACWWTAADGVNREPLRW
jgi:hypothetical protein